MQRFSICLLVLVLLSTDYVVAAEQAALWDDFVKAKQGEGSQYCRIFVCRLPLFREADSRCIAMAAGPPPWLGIGEHPSLIKSRAVR